MLQIQIVFKLSTQKGNDLLLPKRYKKWKITNLVLERTCPEEHPKSEKSGFFRESCHCKPKNTAIRESAFNMTSGGGGGPENF